MVPLTMITRFPASMNRFSICALAFLCWFPARLAAQTSWIALDSGLAVAELRSAVSAGVWTQRITILKIDPLKYEFVAANASAGDSINRTVAEWCSEKQLLGALNAGMFRTSDHLTHSGYLKNFDHVNNPILTPGYKLVLAFNPKKASFPLMQLIDLECEDWPTLKNNYNTYVQGLRIIDCNQKITWAKSEKKLSMVLWGTDIQGNVLWIFSRSPLPVATLASYLLSQDLALQRLMYLEGGPEASLWLDHPQRKLLLMGSDANGNSNGIFRKLPNVIGIRKR